MPSGPQRKQTDPAFDAGEAAQDHVAADGHGGGVAMVGAPNLFARVGGPGRGARVVKAVEESQADRFVVQHLGGVDPCGHRLPVIIQAVPQVGDTSGRTRILAEQVAHAHSFVVIDGDGHLAVLGQVVLDRNGPSRVVVDERFEPVGVQFALLSRDIELALVLAARPSPSRRGRGT